TGNIPLPIGHLQAMAAYATDDNEFTSSQRFHAHLYYLYPVFHINEGSAFEVPIFAGGGLGLETFSESQKTATQSMSASGILPTLAIGMAIQWNGFPVEFMTQTTFALIAPPK